VASGQCQVYCMGLVCSVACACARGLQLQVELGRQLSSAAVAVPPPSHPQCNSVSWHAKDLLLSPSGGLLPLQVVSGTHLDINVTLLPPAATTAATAAATAATAAASTAATAEDARAGLVFKSWQAGGKGAAVLSFNWCSGDLLFDFDEPFPDAYNPHPEDTPDRRRVGGRLRSYRAGGWSDEGEGEGGRGCGEGF